MAAAITSRLEYQIFCAAENCDRRDNLIRCLTCQFFAFCNSHKGSHHKCIPTIEKRGKQESDLTTLMDCFRSLSNPPQPDSQRVRYIRVSNGPPTSWEEPKSSPRSTDWEIHVCKLVRCASEYTLRSNSDPLLVVEFKINSSSSTTLLMKLVETNNSAEEIAQMELVERRDPPRETSQMELVERRDPSRQTSQIHSLTIPKRGSMKMSHAPLWSYGDCLVCGYKDKTVWKCTACGLPIHSQCDEKHKSYCDRISKKEWNEGHDVGTLQIATYLCGEIQQVPQNSRVLHVDMTKENWPFLNQDQISQSLSHPFRQRVLSVLLNLPQMDQRVIVAVDGERPSQRKIIVLTSTASTCTIM